MFVRWMTISRRGHIYDLTYRTRRDAERDAFEEQGDTVIKVMVVELRRGKGRARR